MKVTLILCVSLSVAKTYIPTVHLFRKLHLGFHPLGGQFPGDRHNQTGALCSPTVQLVWAPAVDQGGPGWSR